ncbi:glycosyltransferase [Marmoricola sp. OAE513]|uniref:glycosyltransferase family 2 protein n=1 Tax=Marmoricola sp. OAE513 TaxID=2817894 RepID=UPI00339383DF
MSVRLAAPPPAPGTATVGVVVLTMGTRPEDLAAGLASLQAQRGVDLDILVVGNGWEPTGLPDGVRGIGLPENLGIPGGRNAGAPYVAGDLLFFLDDDARPATDDYVARAVAMFEADPTLGLIHPRVDATEGEAPGRWVPRVRKGDPRRSSPAFVLWEGGSVMRREAFDAVGGWPELYRYSHEGIEFVWRMWDQGWKVWYAGDLVCLHPPIDPTRHETYFRFNARHRVWIAKRNLRWPLSWAYVATWTLVQLVRSVRTPEGRSSLRPWFAGWREGWRVDPGGHKPLKWSTVLLMTRLGRPPVV